MINGSQLRDAYISAANHIVARRQEVDALNVFPVPDGDTGTNMSMTISAAVPELKLMENPTVAEVAKTAASALLRGARGNSGVILSLLFRGFSKGLAGKKEADGADFAQALTMGVEAAYKAVMKPTEGTILTVSRMAAERARVVAKTNPDAIAVWEEIVKEAGSALEQTPEMLPVLKKAGVVDAGGKGLLVVFEGMLSVLRDGVMIEDTQPQNQNQPEADEFQDAIAQYDADITFTYCTEFIVQKKEPDADSLKLRAYLESIGDSVVVVEDEDIIKCHVHTNNPGLALEEAIKYGMLCKMKIENMEEQFAARKSQAAKENPKEEPLAYVPVDPEIPYGIVAVAAGKGLQGLFRDLGASQIVSGGQTMNPSTEDILKAIHATPAQNVFVLPNNKNIIMAAEQAIKLADRNVCVLPSRTVPQGIASMLAFDPDADLGENQVNMSNALETVSTGSITFAARDSDYDGHEIHEGELLALDNGKLSFTDTDLARTCSKLVKQMLERDSSFVTVYYGEDVTPEMAAQAEEAIRQRLPEDVELTVLDGGQPVYYFIISVE
ncbi:MAG: DAK2 domain-containing protein [Oscillospiraceae bacterium]|nr:DAK2 domain-containing protein [Oscillospiraceae bacterium]